MHIVRDGKLAHMSRGMLLLNDSSRRLPPFPYTVEKVSLSWSTETPVRKIVSKEREREVLLVRTPNFQPCIFSNPTESETKLLHYNNNDIILT